MQMFLGSGGRCSKGPAAASTSHRSDYQYNLDNIRGLLLPAGSPGNSGALRSLVLPRALLQHGHVLLRSRQVNIYRATRDGVYSDRDSSIKSQQRNYLPDPRNESYLTRSPLSDNRE
jgi:hypothetical protein